MCAGASLCGNSVWAKCNGQQSVTAVLNAKTHENNRVLKSTDHDHQDTFQVWMLDIDEHQCKNCKGRKKGLSAFYVLAEIQLDKMRQMVIQYPQWTFD